MTIKVIELWFIAMIWNENGCGDEMTRWANAGFVQGYERGLPVGFIRQLG